MIISPFKERVNEKMSIRYGICTSDFSPEAALRAGCAYVEYPVTGLCGLSETEHCEAMNVLFPGDLPLIGPESNDQAIQAYLTGAFARIAPFKPEIVVFGSGRARLRPEGVSAAAAFERLTVAGRMIAAAAEPYGITIALEPLNRGETNCVNSLAEGAELVRSVDRPNFRLLADIYHMLVENEPASEIIANKDLLVHIHVAALEGRICPREADRDVLAPYFAALREIGYKGRLSVEGTIGDLEKDLYEAFALFDGLLS
jgi:sugar phosphate isomerase/epimerase